MIEVIVHKFKMGDVDDPDLYAAQPLHDWEQSEVGQWVMNNAIETPMWKRLAGGEYRSHGYEYQIVAKFTPENYTYYSLKYE